MLEDGRMNREQFNQERVWERKNEDETGKCSYLLIKVALDEKSKIFFFHEFCNYIFFLFIPMRLFLEGKKSLRKKP